MIKETALNAGGKKRFVTLDKTWKEILYAASGFGPNLLMVLLGAYFSDAVNPVALLASGSPGAARQAITTTSLILPAVFPVLWMLAKMFDGLIDIPLAALTDGLRTKWGRRRIPILVSFPIMTISYVLMWIPIAGVDNQLGNTIWIVIMALIFFSTYTMSLIAYYGSLSTVCVSESQRTKVSSYKAFFDTISYSLVYALVPVMLQGLNVHIDKFVFMLTPLMVTILIPVFMIKEGDKWEQKAIADGYDITPLKEEERVGVFQSLKITFTNKLFLRWLAVNSCSFFGLQMFLVSMNSLILGGMGLSGGQMAILNTFAFAPVPMMLYLFNKVKEKKGLRFAFQISLLTFSVSILSFFFASNFVIGPGNDTIKIIIGVVGSITGSFAIGSFFMVPYLIPSQISSVEEKLTKRNHSAMYFAAQAVVTSIVGAVASGLVYENIKMLHVAKGASGIKWAETITDAATSFGVAQDQVFNLGLILVPLIVSLCCLLGFFLAFRMAKDFTPKKVAKALNLEKEYEENQHLFVKERDAVIDEEVLPVNIALWVLTGSIFGAIWKFGILSKISKVQNQKFPTVHYIISLLFFPYYAYVVYKANKELLVELRKNNIEAKDLSILYAILAVLGLNLVSYIIMQNQLNKLAKIL